MTLTVEQAIRNRRTTKAAAMNGKKIPDEQITELLELARWAPNHGRTEPWQFIVYSGDALQNFARDHARLYWENTPEDKRLESTRDRLEAGMQTVSHLIIAIMKRGGNPKIPVFEEIAAASAAVQN
ncbi:MAG TPA: nitroreductase family protein, partial [Parasegetibacter sp.]